MTPVPTVLTLLDRLHTPQQDLASLSFCQGTKEAHVQSWVNALPLTQINVVSIRFYKALPEIVRLNTQPETRLAMLDCLRVPIQQIIEGLSKTFLNQPLILPEAARKTATVAQALQKHLSNGYLVAVRELCAQPEPTPEVSALQACAIHRAITGLGLLLMRSYQLYAPIAGQVWVELHSLYALADTLDLLEQPVTDPLPNHQNVTTIQQAYLRVLLLACARPNQLRQSEVAATYDALEQLSAFAQLFPDNSGRADNLFAVLLDSNQPPVYKSRLAPGATGNIRELNTNQIVAKLEEQTRLMSNQSDARRNAFELPAALTGHLLHAWNILAKRSFERRAVNGVLEVTVGLTNIHFHLSGGMPFNVFLDQTVKVANDGEQGKIFQKRGVQLKPELEKIDNPWGEAFDVSGNTLAGAQLPTQQIEFTLRQQQQQEYRGHHPIYEVPLVDTSPGGYCLDWQGEIPVQVKAGELLGVREKGRNKWSIGVVRWVQQMRASTQLGIQMLAPGAVPVGVAMIQKTGDFSEYLRGLQLPALKAANQPATLLTNAVSFREYSKVKVFSTTGEGVTRRHQEHNLQLTQKTFATGAFYQFTFREIVAPPSAADPEDFDAVWKK